MTHPQDAPDIITVQYVEQSIITAKLTAEQAREALGLGGTPDEYVGSRIEALAKHSPAILAKLIRYADRPMTYSWTLQKIDDPWGDF